ncbi:MAG: hemolysin family protein [Treponema sp.]|nr:hemolysin family protein [Treponema sp.]
MITNLLIFIVIIILIACVGFFTSSETAYLSISKIKVRTMVEEKKRNAKVVAKLKENMDRLLTTVLIGTNFLNSLVSALATALVVKTFGGGGVGLPTLATAFFITTFGQIIPKTLAGLNPEKISCFSSIVLRFLEIVFFPIIWLFERLSHIVVFLIEKIVKPSESFVTAEELTTLIDVGEKEGTIEKDESKMMNKIIHFNDLQVSDIMKHRSFVSSVSITASYDQVLDEFIKSGFSSLAVYKDSPDNVVGVINYKTLLFSSNQSENFLKDLMTQVIFVPATFSVLELLQKFRQEEFKMAVVLSEQGETLGLVTMEDIMRMVFGRMMDENSYDNVPPEDKIKLVSHNSFIVPGELKLDDVNEVLNLNLESDNMNTVGGWLLEHFGYLPSIGNVYIYNKTIFTVEDVYQRRITSIRIKYQ